MLVNFFKLVGFFWPFFKSVIFKDRPVKEVLRANRQFTWLFVILMGISMTLFVTVSALSEAKRTLVATHRDVSKLTQTLSEKERRLETLQRQIKNGELCTPGPYDKRHLLELLGE